MRKRILITADDGYNSVGVRTLARLLKNEFDVEIAATLMQQSATGGIINLKDAMSWGEDEVEGVHALWVDGSPVDAIEVAQGFFKKPFDLVVSGINFGENLSYALVSSGTFSAAVRTIGVNLSPNAIVMSWQTVGSNFLINHDKGVDISEFLKYPGGMAIKIIKTVMENNFYGKELINVNFPNNATEKSKLCAPTKDITKLWKYPLIIDREKKTARQPDQLYSDEIGTDKEGDVAALHNGFITITPLNYLS